MHKKSMEFVWNWEIKKLILIMGMIFLCGLFVLQMILGSYSEYFRKQNHRVLAAFFGATAAYYPEVSEEELIQVLNLQSEENIARGEMVLARYGVFQEYGSESFAMQQKGIHFLYIGIYLFIAAWGLVTSVVFILYLRKRQDRIRELEAYMNILNQDGYRLDLEDNSDDELTGLRNEIYKLTVLLKEQAKRATEQRCVLSKSMENISHQLKTPLTSVTILANNLADNPEMDVLTRQRFLSEITYQLNDMSWLITTMLKLSRLEAGVIALQPEYCRMEAIVEETVQKLEIAAEWKQITIITDLPEKAGLWLDVKWTVEALVNIVKNAMEYSLPGGVVEITGEENEVYTQIAIRDYGEGITEEECKKLFQRFYRGNKTKEDSYGIGLSLAKEIIEREGGMIHVDSKAGDGTIFRIRFLRKH